MTNFCNFLINFCHNGSKRATRFSSCTARIEKLLKCETIPQLFYLGLKIVGFYNHILFPLDKFLPNRFNRLFKALQQALLLHVTQA